MHDLFDVASDGGASKPLRAHLSVSAWMTTARQSACPPAAPPVDLAVFLHGLDEGGAQRRTLSLLGAFAERGLRVRLLLVDDEGPLSAAVPAGVELAVLGAPWTSLPVVAARRRRQVRAAIPALAAHLRRHRPRVLLAAANHVLQAALWAHALAATSEVRLVLRVSNHLSRPGRGRRRRTRTARTGFDRADAIICVSRALAADVQSLHPHLATPVHVLPNPVIAADVTVRAARPAGHPWFDDGGPPIILSVGRLDAQKGQATLLRAFALLLAQRPARLLLLGEGPERARLEAMVRLLDLEGAVDLPGGVDDPLPAMRRAALFVSSSAWEGLPGALIEAMACGCPVVATDCPGGTAEVMDGGRLGRLVPVGDVDALAAAMARALDAPVDPAALQARAAAFSVDAAADAMLGLLHAL